MANYSQLLRSFGELASQLVNLGDCIALSQLGELSIASAGSTALAAWPRLPTSGLEAPAWNTSASLAPVKVSNRGRADTSSTSGRIHQEAASGRRRLASARVSHDSLSYTAPLYADHLYRVACRFRPEPGESGPEQTRSHHYLPVRVPPLAGRSCVDGWIHARNNAQNESKSEPPDDYENDATRPGQRSTRGHPLCSCRNFSSQWDPLCPSGSGRRQALLCLSGGGWQIGWPTSIVIEQALLNRTQLEGAQLPVVAGIDSDTLRRC